MVSNGNYNLTKAPKEYPGKTYHNNYIPEHHLKWWQEKNEVVSSDELIHHKNGNKKDNRIENLEKMTVEEHSRLHAKKGRKHVKIICPMCGEPFTKEKRQTFLQKPDSKASYCSRSCSSKAYHREEEPENMKEYVVEEFIK